MQPFDNLRVNGSYIKGRSNSTRANSTRRTVAIALRRPSFEIFLESSQRLEALVHGLPCGTDGKYLPGPHTVRGLLGPIQDCHVQGQALATSEQATL